MIVNPFKEPPMRRMLGLVCSAVAAQQLGYSLNQDPKHWLWIAWCVFGGVLGLGVLFYQPVPKKLKQWRHPAWKDVPPGHCPICKAKPNEDCDAGLHC